MDFEVVLDVGWHFEFGLTIQYYIIYKMVRFEIRKRFDINYSKTLKKNF